MLKYELRKVYATPEKKPFYFSTGIRIVNILHARLRQKYSSLQSLHGGIVRFLEFRKL
jgi:hypothetical protein